VRRVRPPRAAVAINYEHAPGQPLGPVIRFDLSPEAMADLASVCSEPVRSKLDVVVAAPCPQCNCLFWQSVGDEKIYKTTPFTFVNIATSSSVWRSYIQRNCRYFHLKLVLYPIVRATRVAQLHSIAQHSNYAAHV
jgi:hypothetical protein